MKRLGSVVAALLLAASAAHAQEETFTAELLLESEEVYLGEQFPVQIRVEGSSRPEEPDLSEVTGFEIRYLGGAENNAEFVSVVNGKVSRSSTRGFVFSYYFSAASAGVHVIPAIAVDSEGRRAATEPRRVVVAKPAEGGDFRLSVEAAKGRVYVGEGVPVRVTWYIATPVRSATFVVPFFDNPGFHFNAPELDTTPNGKYAKATVNEDEVIVELGEATLSGRPYTTVTYTTVATPRKAGTYQLPASSVHFEARVERQRQRSLVESFFDTAASGDYRPFVVSAPATAVRVMDLPLPGRPAGFAGHVGRYTIRAQATPREATVGDPITLTLILSGPPNVTDAPPPDLSSQPVAHLFALGSAEPQGLPVTAGTRAPEKAWAFTIRATRAGVAEIPPVELAYFDPSSGRYDVARSAAVPIRIVNARVVTSRDAEGGEPAAARPAATPTVVPSGIASSYEDPAILRRQERGLGNLVRRPLVLLMLLLSLAGVASSAAATTGRGLVDRFRRARHDPFRQCEHRLRELAAGGSPGSILSGVHQTLTHYLGRRLGLPPETATPGEILDRLRTGGIPEGPVIELHDVFRICEAGRYAGYPLSRHTAVEAAHRALAACQAVHTHHRLTLPRPGGTSTTALVIALALALARPASALDEKTAREIFAQATELTRVASDTTPGAPAKARELYRRAAGLLEQLVAARGSGGLYYNLGNAYYRAGELGSAILAYRRAQLLTPRDANVRRNLEQARSETTDRIEPSRPARTQAALMAPSTRAGLAALFLLAGAALLSCWLFLRKAVLIRVAGAVLVPALAFLISLAVSEIAPLARRDGVIIAAELTVRGGDGEIYQPAFDESVHEGTEFRLREERRDWYRIELADGRAGWIPAAGAALVVAAAR